MKCITYCWNCKQVQLMIIELDVNTVKDLLKVKMSCSVCKSYIGALY